jgi:hypothetical protein
VDDYGEEDDDEGIETIDLDELAQDDVVDPRVMSAADDRDAPDKLDKLDELDDVPDFASPTPPSPPSPRRGIATASGASADPVALAAGGLDTLRRRARARELVERFRAASKTGAPQDRQLSSYHHAVGGQIGTDDAAFLTRALFRTPPERTSRDQLLELISWSKEDAFADEVADVLALLRASRPTGTPESEPRQPEAAPAASRPARATRSVPAEPGTSRPRGQPREGRS